MKSGRTQVELIALYEELGSYREDVRIVVELWWRSRG